MREEEFKNLFEEYKIKNCFTCEHFIKVKDDFKNQEYKCDLGFYEITLHDIILSIINFHIVCPYYKKINKSFWKDFEED